ncbi:MAG: hypothetical protein D6771_08200 [Zetaproteobacteria bacterium]|nr:MAG: hypothetical protein D6771_08200 [Zetaproteobacteria bacterium]
MPPAAQALLTRKLPCAALMLVMFTAPAWASLLAPIPVLGLLAVSAALAAHLLVPMVAAIVAMGGGLGFALPTVGLMGAGVWAASGFAWPVGISAFLLYGLAPAIAGWLLLSRVRGLERAAAALLAFTAGVVFVSWAWYAHAQGIAPAELGEKLLREIVQGREASEIQKLVHALAQGMPGWIAAGIWVAWLGNLVLARSVMQRWGLFAGDTRPIYMLSFRPRLGLGFLGLATAALLGEGSVRFWAESGAIALAAPIAAQGTFAVHAWLAAREMTLAIATLYLMLALWSAMILPLLIVGLADLWLDFRKQGGRNAGDSA